jgi:tRNA A37 methylthiotransferase MiaB
MKKVFLYKCGCDRRALDASKVRNYLTLAKYEIVNRIEDADIILFFTCAVYDSITNESLKKVKQFQKYDAELIIAGCLPAIEREKLAEIFNGKTIITKDLDEIKQLFPSEKDNKKLIIDANNIFYNISLNKPFREIKRVIQRIKFLEKYYLKIKNHILKNIYGEHSLMYRHIDKKPFFHIRISTGCLGNCSYCAIKKAIGKLKSKPLDQCINEFKKGIKNGYNHFVIEADDTGAYGLDIKSNFPELLDNLTKIPGEYKISIRSLHPKWIVKYINELEQLLKTKKIVSIESAIQSGSNRILNLMRRFADVQKIKESFQRLQNAYQELSLTTHYILGFPTETEEDFMKTMNFLKTINFSAGFIYSCSIKTGTNAENIKPKVSKYLKRKFFRKAKKFLRNIGYDVINIPRYNIFIFENSRYLNG